MPGCHRHVDFRTLSPIKAILREFTMYAVMKEPGFAAASNEHYVPLLRISLKQEKGIVTVTQVYRTQGPKPQGEAKIHEDVPASIIGHWIEISTDKGDVIFRSYVRRGLPFNMEKTDVKLRRIYSHEHYHLMIPDLPEGRTLTLYEQSRPAPEIKSPQRKTRLTLNLQDHPHTSRH